MSDPHTDPGREEVEVTVKYSIRNVELEDMITSIASY